MSGLTAAVSVQSLDYALDELLKVPAGLSVRFVLEMLGDGCPVGPKITEEGNQLTIFLAGPRVSEGRVLGGLIGGGKVEILFPRALVGE